MCDMLPSGTKPRFEFIDSKGLERPELRQLGTYGIIKGARYFIAGIIKTESAAVGEEKSPFSKERLLDLGYSPWNLL